MSGSTNDLTDRPSGEEPHSEWEGDERLLADGTERSRRPTIQGRQISIRGILLWTAVVAVSLALWESRIRLRDANRELAALRYEMGYLGPQAADAVAAVRAPLDEPLSYRFRVRVPGKGKYRIAYSTLWPAGASGPRWYAAADLLPGESTVVVRLAEDPRDELWKIMISVRCQNRTKRVATVLPSEHVQRLRQPHDSVSSSVGYDPVSVSGKATIRLLDERWIVGENGLLLYGDRSRDVRQLGVFAELQPDDGPL